MSFEALLAVTGLLLTLYSILPTERRLDLRLRLHRFDWFLGAASLAALHYISYYPVLDGIGIAPDLGPWRWGLIRDGRANVAVRTIDLQHENRSIAKSAALALGQVLRSGLLAEKLTRGFKTYLLDIALPMAERRLDGRADLAAVVTKSIAEGGPRLPTDAGSVTREAP